MRDALTSPRKARRQVAREQSGIAVPVMPQPGVLPGAGSGPMPGAAAMPGPVVPMPDPAAKAPPPVPGDFVYETEHPVLPVPFTTQVGDHKLDGIGLSVTAAYVAIEGTLDPAWKGHRQIIRLQFDFQGFSLSIYPEAVVAGARRDGEMTLQFMDPAGEHLPQLRYILNTFIAGDFVSMGGMLSYSGPTKPKSAKAAEVKSVRYRIKSAAVAFVSIALIALTAGVLINRLTQSYEPHPVFIERTGKVMKATTAGQVGFLNPAAKKGEVVFSINANTGDVLNFQLPCNCEVAVTEGIYEGATVLPIDSILSFFEPTTSVKVQTLMSIEGLAKVMSGEQAYLDVSDGRSIAVRVVLSSSTNAAAVRGEQFVPVTLVPTGETLVQADVGKIARLRLSKSWIGGSFLNILE